MTTTTIFATESRLSPQWGSVTRACQRRNNSLKQEWRGPQRVASPPCCSLDSCKLVQCFPTFKAGLWLLSSAAGKSERGTAPAGLKNHCWAGSIFGHVLTTQSRPLATTCVQIYLAAEVVLSGRDTQRRPRPRPHVSKAIRGQSAPAEAILRQ